MQSDSKPTFNRKTCMACRICVDVCPVSCIDTEPAGTAKDPHGYPFLTDEDACISCGQCVEACPVEAAVMRDVAA